MTKEITSNSGKGKLLSNMFIPQVFEPKVDFRHMVYINDANTDEILIHSWVIKHTSIPSFTYNWLGFKKYDTLKMSLYNPINPSSTQAVYNMINRKFNINIIILGPVGDKVEEWKIFNAKIKSIKFSDYDWSNTGNPNIVYLEFKISDVMLLY